MDESEFAPVLRQKKVKKEAAFPDVRTARTPNRRKVAPPSSDGNSMLSKVVRSSALVAVVPVLFSVPYILSVLGEFFLGRELYLVYVWVLYALGLAFVFFFWRRKTITFDSFLTQLMTWAIIALGAYTVVDIPKMVDLHLRQVVLYIWLTFSFAFNFVVFFVDNTDYQEQQRKELAKEERRKKKEEERSKKQEEKKKHKKQKRREMIENYLGRRGMILLDAMVYALLAGVAYLVASYGYQWYLNFREEVASRSRPHSPAVEPEWEPEGY